MQAVCFDLGWTLVAPRSGDWMLTRCFDQHFPHVRREIPPQALAQAQAAVQNWLDRQTIVTLDRELECLTHAYRMLGDALPALGMTEGDAQSIARDRVYQVQENFTLLPGAREALETLRGQGLRLGIISDTWPSVHLQLESYGILPLLDSLTFSYALGVCKPDERMYRHALAQLGVPGSQCWFVDDLPENLLGAQALGMRGIQAVAAPGSAADGRFLAARTPQRMVDIIRGHGDDTGWQRFCCPLTAADLPAMMALQAAMAAALPNPRWYFTSSQEEFAEEVAAGRVLGIRVHGELAAFAIAAPGGGAGSYAAVLGREEPRSLDFQDVMVAPGYRRRGIHSFFLALFEQQARAQGMTGMYATVDPDNLPSLRSFEKAGWQRLTVRSAYDGRIRAYYRKAL